MKISTGLFLPLLLAAIISQPTSASAAPESTTIRSISEPMIGTKGAIVYGGQDREAWIMNTDGSNPTKLTQLGDVTQTHLANGVVVFMSGGRLHRLNLRGFVVQGPPVAIPNTDGVLEFDLSPDASKIVLTFFANSNTTLYTINLDGTGLTPINTSGQHQSTVFWARTGRIYFDQSNIGDAYSQHLFSIPETGVNNPVSFVSYFSQFPAVGGPNNRVAFLYEFPVKRIRVMNADGTGQIDIPGVDAGDGDHIAYDYEQEVIYYTRFGDLFRVNVDGTSNHRLAQSVYIGPDYGRVPLDYEGPISSNVNASPYPVAVNSDASLTATIDDSQTGGGNIASAHFSVDGGNLALMLLTPSGAVTSQASATLVFSQPNVYTICVNGTDAAGYTGSDACILLPVYDPSGGFVTGGGEVASPTGADLLNTSAAGSAKFGFVSKYLPGRNTPSGNLEFQFTEGSLKFKSTSMDWLVVTGQPRAMFRGTGNINGSLVCKFEVDAYDGSFSGNVDAFGLKIFSCANGGDRYSLPATALTKGSIVIHQ